MKLYSLRKTRSGLTGGRLVGRIMRKTAGTGTAPLLLARGHGAGISVGDNKQPSAEQKQMAEDKQKMEQLQESLKKLRLKGSGSKTIKFSF